MRVISALGKKQAELMTQWIDLITTNMTIIEKRISLSMSRDPDDNKFLECAVSGDVDFIVSGDDDLLTLEAIHAIPIIKPSELISKYFSSH